LCFDFTTVSASLNSWLNSKGSATRPGLQDSTFIRCLAGFFDVVSIFRYVRAKDGFAGRLNALQLTETSTPLAMLVSCAWLRAALRFGYAEVF
jgi:hypothetical protein